MALAWHTLALAHLGREEEARSEFAQLEHVLPPLPVPPALAAILLEPDYLALGLAHEEARTLLNLPQAPSAP
jgi:hypothetical protein